MPLTARSMMHPGLTYKGKGFLLLPPLPHTFAGTMPFSPDVRDHADLYVYIFACIG